MNRYQRWFGQNHARTATWLAKDATVNVTYKVIPGGDPPPVDWTRVVFPLLWTFVIGLSAVAGYMAVLLAIYLAH